ncbi:MAG: phosphogluconate dehydrogenase (NAD(+)-dependent, decarboxylating) [Candidatus Auribacterota bacterium]
MKLGIVGLGRMGRNMARRLIQGGHEVVVYNRTQSKVEEMVRENAVGSTSLEDLVGQLSIPRIVWLMLPVGDPTEQAIVSLVELLSPGDILIDGSNGYFKDDIRRAGELKPTGIHYMDAGVSGGIWGYKIGYCTMVGGSDKDFAYIEPILKTLAPENGYIHCGDVGAGHFVKMVHNGIEYALMEAYGEGFELLKASPFSKSLNLKNVAHVWNQGSVVRSWLLELLESAFDKDPDLSGIQGYVEDSGEGRWTVEQAIELGVSATAIAHAVFKRFQSRQKDVFSDKVLAALRNEFGGHAVGKVHQNIRSAGAGAGTVTAARADDSKEIPI